MDARTIKIKNLEYAIREMREHTREILNAVADASDTNSHLKNSYVIKKCSFIIERSRQV